MKQKQALDKKEIIRQLTDGLETVQRYMVLIYMLLLVAVYGFVLYKVSQLISVQPGDADIQSQIKASETPHVDPTAVSQMQTLKDNSVRVQTLFDQARSNPFKE